MDLMMDINAFKNGELLVSAVATLLRDTLACPGSLMLSGGSTPYAAYQRLTAAPVPVVHPERKLFLSDERMVPINNPNSNAGNLMPMLRALDCTERFIPVDTALSPDRAAEQFAVDLAALPSIDLGLLGLGTDGHTAGFFTPAQALLKSDGLTLHTLRPDGMTGVSVTPRFIHRVKRIILLVAGESKRGIISTLLNAPDTIPAGIALAGHPRVELWTDLPEQA